MKTWEENEGLEHTHPYTLTKTHTHTNTPTPLQSYTQRKES